MPLTRRGFFTRTGAAFAGTILGGGAKSPVLDAEPPDVRFAVMFPTRPIRERARLAEGLGYQGVEFSMGLRCWELSPESIQTELQGIDIKVSAIGAACQYQNPDAQIRAQGIEEDRKCLTLAKVLGVKQMGEHYLPSGDTLQASDRLVIDALKQLAPDLKRSGVTMVLEPLSHKDNHHVDLLNHGVQLLEAAKVPGVKLVADFNHMQNDHNDIEKSLLRWGTYVGAVHLPGEKRLGPDGTLFDYRPGFRALKKVGYTGWLTVECCFAPNEFGPGVARALNYVKQQWSEA